jgi:hypothetical protein
MENNNEKSILPEIEGDLSDPMVQERLRAVSKANLNNVRQKSRIKARTTVVVKEASAFGAVNKEISVPREIVASSTVPDVDKTEALQEELDHQLKQKLGHFAVPVEQERLDKATEIRTTLAGLWSIDPSATDASSDKYIEGLPSDGGSAVVNTEAGDSGVRISFKSK